MSCNAECAKELVKSGANIEITSASMFSEKDIEDIIAAATNHNDTGHITIEAAKFTQQELIGFVASIPHRLTIRF